MYPFSYWWILGCFQFLIIMNKATKNILVQVFCGHAFSLLLVIWRRIASVGVHLFFKETLRSFYKVVVLFYTSTNNAWEPQLFYMLASTWYCQSSKCEGVVLSYYSFKLHIPNDSWCWWVSNELIDHSYILFCEVSVQISCPFFQWVGYFFLLLSCGGSLLILNTSPLTDTHFS